MPYRQDRCLQAPCTLYPFYAWGSQSWQELTQPLRTKQGRRGWVGWGSWLLLVGGGGGGDGGGLQRAAAQTGTLLSSYCTLW